MIWDEVVNECTRFYVREYIFISHTRKESVEDKNTKFISII